jgi:hypothetical protein
MAATITGNSTSVTVASVKLRASISTVIPTVGLTRVYPVSEVAYILLAVSAYLDTTGQFKYLADLFSVTDTTSFSTSKIADVDTFTPVDNTALNTAKPLTDTISLNDTVITFLLILRNFTDTATPADAKTLLISPAYSDTFTTSDTATRSISKTLTDAFALNDLADIGDGIAFQFDDYTNNVVSTSDSAEVTSAKGLSDSLFSLDSGTLISQGYCDITYFSENYVGESRTF